MNCMASTRIDLPVVSGSVNPKSPGRSIKQLAMLAVGFTILAWTFFLALNKGVPLMDSLVGRIPGIGNNLQSGGAGTEVF